MSGETRRRLPGAGVRSPLQGVGRGRGGRRFRWGCSRCNLAARGYHVLLLDGDAFPRVKPCSDGLLPDTYLQERMGRVLREESSSEAIFSLAGVIRSFLG